MRRQIVSFLTVLCALSSTSLPAAQPNIVVILTDDMGWSDLGCMGGEISTPNLDALAANGLRFTQFYNTARCCPTRASLLTGLYPHSTGIGHMVEDKQEPGYRGDLNSRCVTIAEALRPAGYRNYAVGKWHVTRHKTPEGSKDNWPLQRGFDRYYGTIHGAGSYFDPSALTRDNTAITPFSDAEYRPASYYYTDAIAEHAVRFIRDHEQATPGKPFFLYVAFTAAHWPLHALPADIARQRGKYDGGYLPTIAARLAKQKSLGLVSANWSPVPSVGDWDQLGENLRWETACMEVYAAQVESMDRGVGQIVGELKRTRQLENTLVLYLQDNGACAEAQGRTGNAKHPEQARADKPSLPPLAPDALLPAESVPPQTREGFPVLMGKQELPGAADTYMAYGEAWAHVSNTPFREYKHWIHEGGISTPLIAHWPAGLAAERRGKLESQPGHLVDVMATCLDLAGAKYPAEHNREKTVPLPGASLRPAFAGKSLQRSEPIYWEHEGNRAVRDGRWKLVAKGPGGAWELYDIETDRTEMHDLTFQQPERARRMADQWESWARANNVLPWIWKPAYGVAAATAETKSPASLGAAPDGKKKFLLRPGESLSRDVAPQVAERGFSITAEISAMNRNGVILAQGGNTEGYSLYLKDGRLTFATRRARKLSLVATPEPVPFKPCTLTAKFKGDGEVTLSVGTEVVGKGQAAKLARTPTDGLQVGSDENGAVGEYEAPFKFGGTVTAVALEVE